MSYTSSESESELSEAVTSYHRRFPAVEVENDDEEPELNQDDESDENDLIEAYEGEPLADEVWLAEYNRERAENERQMTELQRRLEGLEPTNLWCQCGKCNTELLTNARECKCCREVEGCTKALQEDLVVKEVGTQPCITLHPGFVPSCLNRWSLRIAADLFKTRERVAYKKIGTEEKFLRGVAYRQFTRLVHGRLRDKRIPLPACAYHEIRTTFKVDSENFEGYEDNE